MQNLMLAYRAEPDSGLEIPSPLTKLMGLGAIRLRGALGLAASKSGGGKSAVALHEALYARYPDGSPVPTLYISADCDQSVMAERAGSSLLNRDQIEVRHQLRDGDQEVMKVVEENTRHIGWYFDPILTIEDVFEETDAYAVITGDYPHVIVVDNLINVLGPPTDKNHLAMDRVIEQLQHLAKRTHAYVQILHHVTKGYVDGGQPIPLSGILDSVDKRLRLVTSYYQPGPGLLHLSILKNTTGKANADGTFGAVVGWMPERNWIVG